MKLRRRLKMRVHAEYAALKRIAFSILLNPFNVRFGCKKYKQSSTVTSEKTAKVCVHLQSVVIFSCSNLFPHSTIKSVCSRSVLPTPCMKKTVPSEQSGA